MYQRAASLCSLSKQLRSSMLQWNHHAELHTILSSTCAAYCVHELCAHIRMWLWNVVMWNIAALLLMSWKGAGGDFLKHPTQRGLRRFSTTPEREKLIILDTSLRDGEQVSSYVLRRSHHYLHYSSLLATQLVKGVDSPMGSLTKRLLF